LRVRPESGFISVQSPMGPRLAGVEGCGIVEPASS
jgi:hypothetical protein